MTDAGKTDQPTAGPPQATTPPTHRRGRDDAGWVTLWLLGLAVMLLALGGLSLDLWRVFSERRDLAGAVDAAAAAGASGIDVDRFRANGELALDPAAVETLVAQNLKAQTDLRSLTHVAVEASAQAVTVTAVGAVDLTLTRTLIPLGPVTIRVDATAQPARAR